MLALRAACGSLSPLRSGSQDILPEIELDLIGMVAFGLGTKEPVLKPGDDLIFPEKLLLYKFERFERDYQLAFEFLNPIRQFLKVSCVIRCHPEETNKRISYCKFLFQIRDVFFVHSRLLTLIPRLEGCNLQAVV